MKQFIIQYAMIGIYLGFINYFMGDLDKLIYIDNDDEINNNYYY